jgi:hypothetical protein
MIGNLPGERETTQEGLDELIGQEERAIALLFSEILHSEVPIDARLISVARTTLEDGLMYLSRAVAQPPDPIGDAVNAGLQLRRERERS